MKISDRLVALRKILYKAYISQLKRFLEHFFSERNNSKLDITVFNAISINRGKNRRYFIAHSIHDRKHWRNLMELGEKGGGRIPRRRRIIFWLLEKLFGERKWSHMSFREFTYPFLASENRFRRLMIKWLIFLPITTLKSILSFRFSKEGNPLHRLKKFTQNNKPKWYNLFLFDFMYELEKVIGKMAEFDRNFSDTLKSLGCQKRHWGKHANTYWILPYHFLNYTKFIKAFDQVIGKLRCLNEDDHHLWKLAKPKLETMSKFLGGDDMSGHYNGSKMNRDLYLAFLTLDGREGRLDRLEGIMADVVSEALTYQEHWRDWKYDWDAYQKCSDLINMLQLPEKYMIY